MHSYALVLPSGRTQTRRAHVGRMDTYPNRWRSAASLHGHSSNYLCHSESEDVDMQRGTVAQVEGEQSPPQGQVRSDDGCPTGLGNCKQAYSQRIVENVLSFVPETSRVAGLHMLNRLMGKEGEAENTRDGD